jgi:hypothetical protein
MSSRTVRRDINYRGYKIKLERRDLCWLVTLFPACSETDKKKKSFRTITQSERGALAQAKLRVDHALR